MSLTGPVKTPAQLVAERIYAINSNLLQTLQDSLCEGYRTFWSNAQGVSPQDVADALGTDAAQMMYWHQAFALQAYQVCEQSGRPFFVPTSIPEGWAYAVGEDGLMTLTYTPPVVPEPEPTPEPDPIPPVDPPAGE